MTTIAAKGSTAGGAVLQGGQGVEGKQPRATMRAGVIVGPREAVVREAAAPEPVEKMVRVRLEGCGVCGSNLPVWEGRPWFQYPLDPGAPGHEGWGAVESLGPGVTGVEVGNRVAFLSCRAFAERDVCREEELVLLPAALDGKPFPGEALGCAMNVFERSGIRPGETVAIVGVGFLGALLVQLSSRAGARVLAFSRRAEALRLAEESGANAAIRLDDHQRVIEEARAWSGGEGCDCVIEAAGQQWPLDLAAELTRVRGRLVIAGYHQDGPRQVNMQLWNWRGLDVINAHERDPRVYVRGMRAAVDAVVRGDLDPAPLYTHCFDLDELSEALEALRTRPDGFMKAWIRL